MARLIHWRFFTGLRPGKACLTRERPGRPTVNACGADPTSQDCLKNDFVRNVACKLDWARGTDLSLCPECRRLLRESG